jgi:nitrogen fixation protein FixH
MDRESIKMNATAESPTKRLTGRAVLTYLLAFFAVVISVNMVMMKLAVDTMSGTVVDSAYAAGTGYGNEISAARAQAARGWQVEAHVMRLVDNGAALRIDARDVAGAPISGAVFSARLARPTDKRGDRAISLAERERGVYRGSAEDVAAGQWDLIIEADHGGERLFMSRNRVMLR